MISKGELATTVFPSDPVDTIKDNFPIKSNLSDQVIILGYDTNADNIVTIKPFTEIQNPVQETINTLATAISVRDKNVNTFNNGLRTYMSNYYNKDYINAHKHDSLFDTKDKYRFTLQADNNLVLASKPYGTDNVLWTGRYGPESNYK